jgi:transcriptional regulator with XRE-family HTH domain
MFNRLHIVLKEKNVKQEELARYFSSTPAKISRWCNNISQPNWETLHLISNYLKVDITHLIYGTPKTIIVKNEVELSVLGVNDAYLQMVSGKSDLQSIQTAFFHLLTKYNNGIIKSHPINLLSHISSNQNTKIPVIEVGEIIYDCKFTKLKVENCKEELQLTFLCPELKLKKIIA